MIQNKILLPQVFGESVTKLKNIISELDKQQLEVVSNDLSFTSLQHTAASDSFIRIDDNKTIQKSSYNKKTKNKKEATKPEEKQNLQKQEKDDKILLFADCDLRA